MTDLIIDNEFKELLLPLSDEEFSGLEKNILNYGIQDALITWQWILIDGHNRYKIAKRHNLEFQTFDMQFDSYDDVKLWIIDRQLDKRNLPPATRIKLALIKEPIIAAKSKERQGTRTDLTFPTNVGNVELQPTPKKRRKLSGRIQPTLSSLNS